jgi:hypothetical protein
MHRAAEILLGRAALALLAFTTLSFTSVQAATVSPGSSSVTTQVITTPFDPTLPIFTVTIDTPGLTGFTGGIEFSFADGDTSTGLNSAIIGMIQNTGGTLGTPTLSSGAVDDGNGFYNLNDLNFASSFANVTYTGITFGTSITFEFQVTQNGPFINGATPDGFQVALLNQNGGQLGTDGPTGVELVSVPILSGTPLTTADVSTFQGTFAAFGQNSTVAVVSTAVPEPSPLAALALGAILVSGTAALRNRKFS